MPQKEKNYGIEMLRILSMIFVVTLHVLGQCGILGYTGISKNIIAHPWNYKLAWILETGAYGAVNLFGLVSGFVGLRSKWATKKYLRLWTLVVFWGVSMVLLVDKGHMILDFFNASLSKIIPCVSMGYDAYEFTGHEYIEAIFTVSNKQYWYFNMYTLLFLFMPLLNAAISKLNKKQLALIASGLFLITSVQKTIAGIDLFVMSSGYSALWLIIMYITGAAVRRYYDEGFVPSKVLCIIGYILCTAIPAEWRFTVNRLIEKYPENKVYPDIKGRLISYTSPFIVLGAVFLLMLFMQFRLKTSPAKKIVSVFADTSFAVYIIHVQPVFWKVYMSDRFYKAAYEPSGKMLLYTFTAIAVIYIFCTLLEVLRRLIFKVSRLDKLIDLTGDGIDKLAVKIFALENK